MKKKIVYLMMGALLSSVVLTGCDSSVSTLSSVTSFFTYDDAYETVYEEDDSLQYGSKVNGMTQNLVVIPKDKQTDKKYKRKDLHGAICINLDAKEPLQKYKVFKKVYPASITKVMTALVVLENADLDDVVTVDENITFKEDDAVKLGLKKGDKATVDQLFNALLVHSTNDAAIILAKHVAGSEEEFVKMMNEEAKKLGATGTHFSNSHGLHEKDHYTTPYDLYLIFKKACTYDKFIEVVSQSECEFVYTDKDGDKHVQDMESSNQYLTGEREIPDGVRMIGGKTGTTNAAGSCLIVLTKNKDGDRMITAVLGADDKDDLYRDMSELISKTSKK